jgi:tRNA modification GTPase
MTSVPTIFALSSGRGRAGVAVVRLSGPRAGDVLDLMAPPRPKPRFAAFRRVRDPQSGEVIDEGLVLYFAGPKTETGEDIAELHIHGGRAVIARTLAAIGRIEGCRLAEPGEFSRRAFLNGKIDLTAAEGLADLVDAETEAQRRQALRQVAGEMAAVYAEWRRALVEACGLVEAAIDFSDEADVAEKSVATARERVEGLVHSIRQALDNRHRGEIVREGFHVALAGAPNAGKSSLLNVLARREAAIVSEEAGTTRDVIEVRLDLCGLPVIISDTAGLREATGAVEREGIRRTIATAQGADLVLWLQDASGPAVPMPKELLPVSNRVLPVVSKIDLAGGVVPTGYPAEALGVSAKTGIGLDKLQDLVADRAAEGAGDLSGTVVTQARHRQHLEAALGGLEAFLVGDPAAAELRAEDLRRAALQLGRITGHVGAEEVLGEIFGRFCIGK